MTIIIEFKSVKYRCRVVNDKDNNELIIAPLLLLDALHPGEFGEENDGWVDKEAEKLDSVIFYYTYEDNLKLDDKALIEALKEDNAEWFNLIMTTNV